MEIRKPLFSALYFTFCIKTVGTGPLFFVRASPNLRARHSYANEQEQCLEMHSAIAAEDSATQSTENVGPSCTSAVETTCMYTCTLSLFSNDETNLMPNNCRSRIFLK